MLLHSEMTSVTFKARTKKMQTVVRSWSKDGMTQSIEQWQKYWSEHGFRSIQTPDSPSVHLRAQWYHNNLKATFQRLFSDTIWLTSSKKMPVLTKHQPKPNDRWNKTSGNQSVIHPLKDTTTTWEKCSKDSFPDVMELTPSNKTSAGQQATYCFANLLGCVEW